jgi:2'-5' RNA ligase
LLPPAALGQPLANLAAGFIEHHRLQRPNLQEPGRHHVTLCNVWKGRSPLPENTLTLALAAGKAASTASGDFEIEMGEVACVYRLPPQKHVLVLKPRKGVANAALRPFQRTLAAQLQLRGLPQDRSFSPHLTLAYYDPCPSVPPQAVETVRWQAGELVLVESHVGRHHYAFPGRWPLRPSTPQAAYPRPDTPQPSLF